MSTISKTIAIFMPMLLFGLALPAQGQNAATPEDAFQPRSTTIGRPGDYLLEQGGGLMPDSVFAKQGAAFGQEIQVRSYNGGSAERNQDMVVDSEGNLYIAWEDGDLAPHYIQMYWSQDGGLSWQSFGYLMAQADLVNPSLAIGEGAQDLLVVAYTVDDWKGVPFLEVATTPLAGANFTITVPTIKKDYEAFTKPSVWTDSVDFDQWRIYLTCQGVYDSAANDYRVLSWVSTDFGATWSYPYVVFGDVPGMAWLDPEGAYGTTMQQGFIVCYHDNSDTVWVARSPNYGVTYHILMPLSTLPSDPVPPVDPEIEAAFGHDGVMICLTMDYKGYAQIGHIHSTNAGGTWSTLAPVETVTKTDKFAPELIANEGGQSWHLAYTSSYKVYHNACPQDLSHLWQSASDLVCGTGTASNAYPKKGIACNRSTDAAYVCWADDRDGAPDFDTFFSFSGALVGSVYRIPAATGGASDFILDAGAANANRNYLILGSVSGIEPGIPLPGGMAVLPLNWDLFTNLVINMVNGPFFVNFMGQLDGNGQGKAKLNLGAIPGGAGLTMYFAFALNDPWDFASNPIAVHIE